MATFEWSTSYQKEERTHLSTDLTARMPQIIAQRPERMNSFDVFFNAKTQEFHGEDTSNDVCL